MPAEASGGTLYSVLAESMHSPTKLRWLVFTVDPSQEQPQDVDCSIHVPVPQRTSTFCGSTQSYTVGVSR